jgi:tryptophan synthase beta chain
VSTPSTESANSPLGLPTAGEVIATPTAHDADERGHWGDYGGRYIPEALMAVVTEIEDAWGKARVDPTFLEALDDLHRNYTGRPSPLYYGPNFSKAVGAKVYFKREDLNHTGSHKINNVLGQVLLAKRMGKDNVIAETGAGQHGVATATACALLGLNCRIYMGEVDAKRQALNIARMRLLGAEVIEVTVGSATLKDAINEAMRP